MGVFDDKAFQELDWISQATEPICSKLNDILARLPDETEITFDMIKSLLGQSDYRYSSISNSNILRLLLRDVDLASNLSYQERDELESCFKLKVSGENIILNAKDRTISGGIIHLVKTSFTLDEKSLENLLGREGIMSIRDTWMREGVGSSRANDVMEILGKCESGLRSRSLRKKRYAITQRLTEIFKTNEWRIRDTTLSNKVGYWITSYLKDGNLSAWSNFCRLKVMTHKGDPIYSMEEVE